MAFSFSRLIFLASCLAGGVWSFSNLGVSTEQPSRHEMQQWNRHLRPGPSNKLVIDTYFHVVDSTTPDFELTQDHLDRQFALMNKAYRPHSISFRLVETTRSVNDSWSILEPEEAALDMLQTLRTGSYSALNIYFLSDFSEAGFATYAAPNVTAGTIEFLIDGAYVSSRTVPGGNYPNRDNGITVIHEIGHWLGLYHPFNGEVCKGEGDFVADTPISKEIVEGCPTGVDSCPDQPGLDAINNYMAYTSDACRCEFTRGQRERMHQVFAAFREGK